MARQPVLGAAELGDSAASLADVEPREAFVAYIFNASLASFHLVQPLSP